MLKQGNINLKVINYTTDKDNELGESLLEYKLSGDNIDYIVANTIRRVIFKSIPIYAFNQFKFEKNTSIFNNSYIKLRLRQIPVWGIDNKIDTIDIPNNLNTNLNSQDIQEENEQELSDNVTLEAESNLVYSSLKQLTMYVNYKNKTNNIVSVTTDDAKFYFDEKNIKSPYKTPILLVKLQPKQEIIFSAVTDVGIEEMNAMYSAVCANYYKMINDNEFLMCLESRGQIDEKRILSVALINIKKKLNNFLKLVTDETKVKMEGDILEGVLIVNNEDHTLGNLITRGMQQHKDISFAGYNLPHPLSNKVHFNFKLKKGTIIKVMKDVVEYYLDLFDNINKLVKNNIK
jgi:DNA-directed RNA polymerase subunit L